MSDDGIQLSPQLMAEMREAIERQDPRAKDDVLAMQYLVAAVGMMLSDYGNADINKQNALEDLAGFMKHVFDYMEQQKAAQAPQPPAEDAFGTWQP